VSPVVGEPQLDQHFKDRMPNAHLRPAPEPDIDRIPIAIIRRQIVPGRESLC
jgi:hypothetical protein